MSEEVLTRAVVSMMGIKADRAALHVASLMRLGAMSLLGEGEVDEMRLVVSEEARWISRHKNRCIVDEIVADGGSKNPWSVPRESW